MLTTRHPRVFKGFTGRPMSWLDMIQGVLDLFKWPTTTMELLDIGAAPKLKKWSVK